MNPSNRQQMTRRTVATARASFYWVIKAIAWPVTLIYVRLRVRGLVHVPRTGPCLVVANHSSYVDAIVIGSAFPRRITFMITEPIYRMLRLRWFYYMMGTIPIDPDAPDPGALKSAIRTLKRHGVVGIFPEGQRMPGGSLGEGKAGAALLAARTGVPVVPAAIIGARRVMPVGSMLPRPLPIQVVFGRPLSFPAWTGRRPRREEVDAFADRMMKAIADLMGGTGPASAASRGTVGDTAP